MSLRRSNSTSTTAIAAAAAAAAASAMANSPVVTTAATPPSVLPPNLIVSTDLTLSLQRYLQRRQYTTTHPENTLTVQEYALRLALGNETSSGDAVSFSCVSAEAGPIDQQYSKFKIWISESPEHFKPELAQLLYPMFTHLYLELVSSGQKTVALKFHKRHNGTFQGNVEFSSFIRLLSTTVTPEAVSADPAVSAFRASKWRVTLSPKTFNYLKRYLQSCGGLPVLLHVLSQKVDLKLADSLAACMTAEPARTTEKDKDAAPSPSKRSRERTAPPPSAATVEAMERLRETIGTVRNGPSPLPTIGLYKLTHAGDRSGAAPHPVISSTISSDARLLSATTEDSAVHVWSLLPQGEADDSSEEKPSTSGHSSGDLLDPAQMRAHQKILLGCDFGDEGEEEGDEAAELFGDCRTLRGHSGPVYASSFVPVPTTTSAASSTSWTGRHLLSCSEDTTLRLWDLETLTNRAVYQGHTYPVWCVDIDRLGTNVVSGSMDRTAKLWNLEYTHPIRIYAGHEKDIDVIKWHPNCNYFVTGSVDKSVRMWSHADAKMVRYQSLIKGFLSLNSNFLQVRVFSGHRGGIYALAFSPDGRKLATGGEDKRIRIWDLASSNVIKELKGHTDIIYSLSWSPDSSLLSSGAIDGTLRLWDINGSTAPAASAVPSGILLLDLKTRCSTQMLLMSYECFLLFQSPQRWSPLTCLVAVAYSTWDTPSTTRC